MHSPEQTRLGPGQHFSISAYWFATNLLWGAFLMIIAPRQMVDLAPRDPASSLGLLLGLGAVPALLVPLIIGPLSDRCTLKLGRRRPYMIGGVAANILGLFVVLVAGLQMKLWLYFIGYFITNIGNNVATGAYSGVIPDVVPVEQRGEASGWMAAMSQSGTILGVLSAGVLMGAGHVVASYLVIAISLVVFLAITVTGVREAPRQAPPEEVGVVQFITSLWIDPRKHPDFAWVWITRALVVMGLFTVQEFMMYYLVDMVHVPVADMEMTTGFVLVLILACATVTGLLGGRLSDRVGRKLVVYVSNTVVAIACIAFLLSPSLAYIYVVAAVFGLAFGAYYSVDWALGCDVLPNKEDAAKDMAVWHIAFVLPQTIILPIAGRLLGIFGVHYSYHNIDGALRKIPHYALPGYRLIFVMAACFLLLGAIFLRNVRGVK